MLQPAAPKRKLEASPIGLQTPNAWLPGLGAGQAVVATWRSVCPALGAWAAYLYARQTKHTCGA